MSYSLLSCERLPLLRIFIVVRISSLSIRLWQAQANWRQPKPSTS